MEICLDGVQAIVAVMQLDDLAIGLVSNRQVVLGYQAFQIFNQNSLKVANSAGLHGGVDEALAASHAVEIKLFHVEAFNEIGIYKAPRVFV